VAGRRASRDAISREDWAARVAAATADKAAPSPKRPISAPRIVEAALAVVESHGYEALTMRSVSSALQTGPASLYAHVRNKSELDDLLIGELCARIDLPPVDPSRWQEQFIGVCTELRDQLLRYPGVARAALAAVPSSVETLRVGEALLGILLAGGASPRAAAWASDAAFLYVAAYCLEAGIVDRAAGERAQGALDREEAFERLRMLPPALFPHTVKHARELTTGAEHERFEFTLDLMLRGLSAIR
jgi:AcrR family transcriptional regulator